MTVSADRAGSDVRVREWAAPRGHRDERDRWRWSLESRPAGSYLNDIEQAAVTAYRGVAAALVAARQAKGWSLRELAHEVGEALTYQAQIAPRGVTRVPLSVLTGLEQGSNWPDFETLAAVAWTLDHKVQLTGPPVPGLSRLPYVAGAQVEEQWGWVQVTIAGYPDGPPAAVVTPQRAWRIFAIYELLRRADAAGLAPTRLARRVGLRPNTITDLRRKDRIDDTVSVKTLLALAVGVDSRLEVVPQDCSWPQR